MTSEGTSMAGSVDSGRQLPAKCLSDIASGFSGNLRPCCTVDAAVVQSRSEIISVLPPPAEPAGSRGAPKAASA